MESTSVEGSSVTTIPSQKPVEFSLHRVVYGIFIGTMVIDVPALLVFIVIGAVYRTTCEVIAPLFLILGGSMAVAVYIMLLFEILARRGGTRKGYAQIAANFFEILKLGCYLGAGFTMWIFWSFPCSRTVYYTSAIAAPIFAVLSILQIFIISKV